MWGICEEQEHPCVMQTTQSTDQFIICEIQTEQHIAFKELKVTAWNALRYVPKSVTGAAQYIIVYRGLNNAQYEYRKGYDANTHSLCNFFSIPAYTAQPMNTFFFFFF